MTTQYSAQPASAICRSFQEQYGWTDDTMLALLWEWIDFQELTTELAQYLTSRADEDCIEAPE